MKNVLVILRLVFGCLFWSLGNSIWVLSRQCILVSRRVIFCSDDSVTGLGCLCLGCDMEIGRDQYHQFFFVGVVDSYYEYTNPHGISLSELIRSHLFIQNCHL